MNRNRQLLFALVGGAATVWSLMVFFNASVRFEHGGVITQIRRGEKAPQPAKLEAALIDYGSTVETMPCNLAMVDDLLLLRAYATDQAMREGSPEQSEAALGKMIETLGHKLACTPRDGKAWLDLAIMRTFLEGFGTPALNAYKLSGEVAPGESWIAEKRLIFALSFQSMFDQEARSRAISDLAVLSRAHPNRMTAVEQAANVESPEALKAVFQPATP